MFKPHRRNSQANTQNPSNSRKGLKPKSCHFFKRNGQYKADYYKFKTWMNNQNKQEGISLAHACPESHRVDVRLNYWWIDIGESILVRNSLVVGKEIGAKPGST